MALKKAFTTQYGVAAEYWRIVNRIEDYAAGQLKVVFAGYVSQAIRTAGSAPLAPQDMVIGGTDYTPDMPRAQLYVLAKTFPNWADAEDC